MEPTAISAAVRVFLREVIETYEQLEALLLLHGAGGEPWSAKAVANALNIAEPAATQALDELCRLCLCGVSASTTPTYRYAPPSPATAAVVADLAAAYDSDRIGIIRLMNDNAIERVRTKAARMFADAFILGRKKD